MREGILTGINLNFLFHPGIRLDRKSLTHKTGWSAVASFFNFFARLMTGIIIARWLGPDGNGQVAYLIWIIETASVFVELGLESSLTRYLAEFGLNSDAPTIWGIAHWMYSRFILRTILGALLVAGFCFFYRSPAHISYAHFGWVLTLYFILRSFGNAYQAFLIGIQQYSLSAKVNFISGLALLAGVAFGIPWLGVSGAIAGYALGILLPALGSVVVLVKTFGFPPPPAPLRRRIWIYSLQTWAAILVSAFVWSRMEVFFIERYWSAHEVSMFVIGLGLAALIVQTSAMLTGAFLSHFAELSGTQEINKIRKTYSSATRLLALLVFPMAFGCAGLVPVLLPLLYGESFRPAIPNAMVLVAASGLMFCNIGSALIYGMEKSRFIAVSGFLGAGAALLADFLIIPGFGAWGAVWAKTTIQFLMIATGVVYIHFFLGCPFPFKSVFKIFIGSTFCGLSAFGMVRIFPTMGGLAAAVLAGFFVYGALLWLLKAIHPDEGLYLIRMLQKLPKPWRGILGTTIRAVEERP
jgi:O-antigen/teichoic acid export membrane protein